MQEPAFHEIQFNSFLLLILHKIQPDHTVGFHHVFQGTHRFCPGPSFKTTIRIDNQLLWGRRSVFYLQQKPLLVSEVFLPAFATRLSLYLPQ